MRKIGIYIHIPFCKQKCSYCDFVSFPKDKSIQEQYIQALIKEIKERKIELQNLQEECQASTVYVGGGTPSYIEANAIKQILEEIKQVYRIENDAEFTIEMNPGTISEEKLRIYKESGINRISIGLQTTQDNLLKQIGRIHTYEQFLENYKLARKLGFSNINVDLMIGLPNQNMKNVEESIERVIKLNPEHISVYSLILEEGTKLYEQYLKNELELPTEEMERDMYWKVKEKLEKAGYRQYEISNFAKQGKESKHNLACWNQKEYLGFGLAAHSYLENTRYSNTEDIEEYMKNIELGKLTKNRILHETQTEEDKRKEYMLLGLRKIEGVSISKFKEKFVQNPLFLFRKELNRLVEENLITVELDQIKLTPKGLNLANIVWEEFV
ncbi:MAG: radical SAM family heme chaperone HemW [Clostridia bacterium]